MRLSAAVVVLGILASSACRARAEETKKTACSLVGQEEMSRILGSAVAQPAAEERGGTSICTYTPAAGKGATPYAQLKIDWNGGEAAMAGVKLADRFMSKDAGFSVVQKIDGVGDEASMMIGGLMTVRRGAVVLTIDLRMQPRAKEKGVAIAKAVLARIDEGAK